MPTALWFRAAIAVLAGCGASTGDASGDSDAGASNESVRDPDAPATSGQPPDSSGGQSGDPGSGGPSVCSGDRWDGPEMPWINARCTQVGEAQFSCTCVEQDPFTVNRGNVATGTQAIGPPSFVAACRSALRDQCDIDPDAPVFCGRAEVGTCWPDAAGEWSCECGQGVEYRVSDSDCDRALWASCGDQCETAFGTCGETREASYRCECTGVDGPLPRDPEPPQMNDDGTIQAGGVVLDSPQTCAAAMTLYCGDRCANSAGRCVPAADGFECTCNAGGGGMQSFADLGGISPAACTNALESTCGGELIAPMTTCTEPVDSSIARCEASPRVWAPGEARPDGFEYRCTCSDGADTVVVEDTACYRAMLAACDDVIGAVPGEAAEVGELGSLCTKASECSGGICHLGRLQRDGVCSAPCRTDEDCSSDALCSWSAGADVGHCFVTCDSNAGGYFACERLNAASDDPLNCLDRVDLDAANLSEATGEGGQICAPLSDQYWPLPVRR